MAQKIRGRHHEFTFDYSDFDQNFPHQRTYDRSSTVWVKVNAHERNRAERTCRARDEEE